MYFEIMQWLLNYPTFLSNPLYVGGDSYGGKMTPLVALEIIRGNEDLQQPLVNLKLILKNCVGQDFLKPQTALCAANLNILNEFFSEINIYNILEPKCPDDPRTLKKLEGACRSLKEKSLEHAVPDTDCTNSALLSYYWSNDNLTKEALHIKKGTVKEWLHCRTDIKTYTYNVPSSVPHHLNLTSRGYRALIYSGDHDLDVPFISTLEWIRTLNFSVIAGWHSWRAGGQVAGYSMLFSNNLTFATVKGGSHTPPDNMPLQCFTMFERWISHEFL